MNLPTIKINEIFYSLQGEGGRMGSASIFIRLSGCNLKCPFCDTKNHAIGQEMSLESLLMRIYGYPSQWIIWTGGEPTLQLTEEIVQYVKGKNYWQAIETNGTLPIPKGINYVTVSPKSEFSINNVLELGKNGTHIDEIRIPVSATSPLSELQLKRLKYIVRSNRVVYISPIMTPCPEETESNIQYATKLVLLNPSLRLSIQMHKLINIL